MITVLLAALLLDYFFAEPKQYHPLDGFRHVTKLLAERLNDGSPEQMRINGIIALFVCLIPVWWLTDMFTNGGVIGFVINMLILYFVISLRDIKYQGRQILSKLNQNETDTAYNQLEQLMSKELHFLESQAIARITTEAVLERANNVVFGVIFWLLVAGIPGAVVYRLAGILNDQWQEKRLDYRDFGFFVSRFYDLINFIPARLTALSYAMMGNWHNAQQCCTSYAQLFEKSNSGVLIATGAGSLDVQLGGKDSYHEAFQDRAVIANQNPVDADTIELACQLLNRATILWCATIALVTLGGWI